MIIPHFTQRVFNNVSAVEPHDHAHHHHQHTPKPQHRCLCLDMSIWRCRLSLIITDGISGCDTKATLKEHSNLCSISGFDVASNGNGNGNGNGNSVTDTHVIPKSTEEETRHEENIACYQVVARLRGGVHEADGLISQVKRLLDSVGWKTVDTIAVTIGPGSFTGIRVALSAVRGLAIGWGISWCVVIDTITGLACTDRVCCVQQFKGESDHRRYYSVNDEHQSHSQALMVVMPSGSGGFYLGWHDAHAIVTQHSVNHWHLSLDDCVSLLGQRSAYRLIWGGLWRGSHMVLWKSAGLPLPDAVYHSVNPSIIALYGRQVACDTISPRQLVKIYWHAMDLNGL